MSFFSGGITARYRMSNSCSVRSSCILISKKRKRRRNTTFSIHSSSSSSSSGGRPFFLVLIVGAVTIIAPVEMQPWPLTFVFPFVRRVIEIWLFAAPFFLASILLFFRVRQRLTILDMFP